jgi:hypothetical protein
MNHVNIGASTKAVWLAAFGAGLAFVVEWVQSGSAPAWLAAISGVLVILNNAFRSWQANYQAAYDPNGVDETALIDELPAEPTDAQVG